MRAPNRTLALLFLTSCGLLPSLSGAAPELLPDAPERYVVRPDDTLWGVAGRFLRDPWRWNELLAPSAERPDPEQLYPGDVLVLTTAGGEPSLSLIRGGGANTPAASARDDIPDDIPVVKLSPKPRVTGLKDEVPIIPIASIAPFLSQPYVADSAQLDHAAYVVGFPDEHIVAGRGDAVYARRLGASAGGSYQIVRPGDALRDPDSNDLLGYEAEFLASAALERQGDPARLRITRSEREVGIGDRIIPAELEQPLENFLPRPAPNGSRARILSVMNGVSQIGQYDVVILNRGERDGIESGHLFEVFVGGVKERDQVRARSFDWNWRDETPLSSEFWYGDFSFRGWREDAPHDNAAVPLHADVRPDRGHYLKPYERAGVLMVFRVFDRVSFALVLEATRAMGVGDRLAPPAS
ncbi:MAG: LysM peptidoglycan-binding domain-containing protein [Chromatiaceae bacterium]|nr:LysM peptidoglycan-binding domain-containing protein [Chromatiaceae bacterium]